MDKEEKDVKIKVTLTVKGVDISLSPDEVEGLIEALRKVSGKDSGAYRYYDWHDRCLYRRWKYDPGPIAMWTSTTKTTDGPAYALSVS